MSSKTGKSSKKPIEPIDQDDSSSSEGNQTAGVNAFKNDGSFLEMFKRKMEEEEQMKDGDVPAPKARSSRIQPPQSSSTTPVDDPKTSNKSSLMSFVGKRRGGKVLPTGMVNKKIKKDDEELQGKSDAWTQYMAEVKRYKERSCEDEGKTRPLVK